MPAKINKSCALQLNNEMVSFGDTAISLHILQLPLMGGDGSGKGQIWRKEN